MVYGAAKTDKKLTLAHELPGHRVFLCFDRWRFFVLMRGTCCCGCALFSRLRASIFCAVQTAQEIKEGKTRPSIKLAVDGYALLYYLYFSNNFNCVCGGQYAQFAECTRTYISNLLKCG